jgi:AraC-like DNA-binding protein
MPRLNLDWVDLAAFVTWIQLVLLAVAAFVYKKGKRLSNRLLSGFLASNSLIFVGFFLYRFHLVSQWVVPLFQILCMYAYLLLMPFLYLYIQSLCYRNFRLEVRHLAHAVPYGIMVLFSILLLGAGRFGLAGPPVLKTSETVRYWVHNLLLHLQIALYLITSVHILTDYRRKLKDLYSSLERVNLSWFNVLLIGFALMWLIDMSGWLLDVFHYPWGGLRSLMTFTSVLINLAFALSVTFLGISHSGYLSGIEGSPRYASSRLKTSDCKAIVDRLTSLMEKEKPYLTPSISLKDLARKLKVPARQLSQSIHSCLQCNFYDLINRYRIDEAKRRIGETSSPQPSILAVGYDVGFNSKSVFNTSFKKHVGMTPREFRSHYSSPSSCQNQ